MQQNSIRNNPKIDFEAHSTGSSLQMKTEMQLQKLPSKPKSPLKKTRSQSRSSSKKDQTSKSTEINWTDGPNQRKMQTINDLTP